MNKHVFAIFEGTIVYAYEGPCEKLNHIMTAPIISPKNYLFVAKIIITLFGFKDIHAQLTNMTSQCKMRQYININGQSVNTMMLTSEGVAVLANRSGRHVAYDVVDWIRSLHVEQPAKAGKILIEEKQVANNIMQLDNERKLLENAGLRLDNERMLLITANRMMRTTF